MNSFHADDWFIITGRGLVAVIREHGLDDPGVLSGQRVEIDGKPYDVTGVETHAVHHGHRKRPVGLLVKAVVA